MLMHQRDSEEIVPTYDRLNFQLADILPDTGLGSCSELCDGWLRFATVTMTATTDRNE